MKAFFGKIWAWVLANKVLAAIIAGGTAVVLAVAIAVPCGVSAAKKRKAAQEETSIPGDNSGSQSGDQGGQQSGDQGGQQSGGGSQQGGGHTTHTWAAEWSHDETNHWHACTGCTEKNDVEAHKFGPWTVVSAEKEERTCSTCGYKEERAHTHTFADAWSHDETNHWHPSNCGHAVTNGSAAHELDEVGLCETCLYYAGETIQPDQSVNIQTVVADEVYLLRFQQVVGAHYQLQTNYSLVDADTAIKGFGNGALVDVPLDFNHGAVATDDGYYYLKFVPHVGAADIYFKVTTCDYAHGYINNIYIGETYQIDEINHANVEAGLRYFRKVAVSAGDKYYYRMENDMSEVIGEYSFYTYHVEAGNNVFSELQPDGDGFVTATYSTEVLVAVDVFEACNYSYEHFEVKHTELNAFGFCVNCEEYAGNDIAMHEDVSGINLDYDSAHPENSERLFFRLHLETPVAIERYYYGELQSGDISVYRRTGDGIEDFALVDNLSKLSYNVPAASSDGYYYVVIKPNGSDIADGGFWFEDDHSDFNNFTNQGFCKYNGAYFGIDVNTFGQEIYFDQADKFEGCFFAFFRFRPADSKAYYLYLKNQLSHELTAFHTYCKDGAGFVELTAISYCDMSYSPDYTPRNYSDIIDSYDNDGYVYIYWETEEHTGEEFTNEQFFKVMEVDA